MDERQADLRRILGLLDLTSLDEHDTPERIEQLCRRSVTRHGPVAAVCVYPAFVTVARQILAGMPGGDQVAVATVANFPAGDGVADQVAAQVGRAVAEGADEVDLVFPWRAFLDGDGPGARRLLEAGRQACGDATFKVILETGELEDPERIGRAAEIAIDCGADFLKTSTGKTPVSATPAAARTLLETIRGSGRDVGCKVSGGIRRCEEALVYLDLAGTIMGEDWIDSAHLRFGASGLLDELLQALDKAERGPSHSGRRD